MFGDRRIDADDSAKASSKIDDSWNAVFDRRDGWTGADCAGTVSLRDGRMLWLALSRSAELLSTYLMNSQEFGDLGKDVTIYRPKFLRLPLSTISVP